MTIDLLHVVLATGVMLLWLVIVIGWLATCRHGDRPCGIWSKIRDRSSKGEVLPAPHDRVPSMVPKAKSVA
jgi:hypothetical protein